MNCFRIMVCFLALSQFKPSFFFIMYGVIINRLLETKAQDVLVYQINIKAFFEYGAHVNDIVEFWSLFNKKYFTWFEMACLRSCAEWFYYQEVQPEFVFTIFGHLSLPCQVKESGASIDPNISHIYTNIFKIFVVYEHAEFFIILFIKTVQFENQSCGVFLVNVNVNTHSIVTDIGCHAWILGLDCLQSNRCSLRNFLHLGLFD